MVLHLHVTKNHLNILAELQERLGNRISEFCIGDLQLAGEIVEYSQTNKSVSSDGYSAQVQLKITVNVRFVNNVKHEEDFEQRFSATADYDSSQQLATVQEKLVQEMIDNIVDQIFNATVANW